jgi:hypothetical protein
MKKIISIILVLMCAFALFSCGDENTTDLTIAGINEMYNATSPTKVDITTTQTFGKYTLTGTSTLTTGIVDGFSATVYEYSQQQLRDVESGSGEDILDPIETVTGSWVYHEDLGYRENGGDWDITGDDFTPETGAIALNISKDTVKDFQNDAENKTVTFTVEAANTETVFGDAIASDVAVVIVYSGADITSVSLSYKITDPDKNSHPEIAITVKAEYSYDSQVITID